MKVLYCVLAAVVLTVQAERDWSNIKRPEYDIVQGKFVYLPIEVPAETRIVGGEQAEPHAHPYQAALFLSTPDGTLFCGGSIISKLFILTAAHCVEDATSVEVLLGAHNIYVNEPSQVSITSASITIHSGWNPSPPTNDVAVIRLQTEAPLNLYIQTINLPNYSDVSDSFSGREATLAGWGRPSDSVSSISEVLNFVRIPVITNLLCNIQFLGLIQSSHICTSGDNGRGACSGDSGGPLVVGYKQVGIVSFGLAIGCERGWPSVYARVGSYLDWIVANSDAVVYP